MSAAVTDLVAHRTTRRPAKVAFVEPIKATVVDLARAVRRRDEAPADVDPERFDDIVGLTALHLGFCSLGRPVELDLGNGHVLVCTVRPQEAACAG